MAKEYFQLQKNNMRTLFILFLIICVDFNTADQYEPIFDDNLNDKPNCKDLYDFLRRENYKTQFGKQMDHSLELQVIRYCMDDEDCKILNNRRRETVEIVNSPDNLKPIEPQFNQVFGMILGANPKLINSPNLLGYIVNNLGEYLRTWTEKVQATHLTADQIGHLIKNSGKFKSCIEKVYLLGEEHASNTIESYIYMREQERANNL